MDNDKEEKEILHSPTVEESDNSSEYEPDVLTAIKNIVVIITCVVVIIIIATTQWTIVKNTPVEEEITDTENIEEASTEVADFYNKSTDIKPSAISLYDSIIWDDKAFFKVVPVKYPEGDYYIEYADLIYYDTILKTIKSKGLEKCFASDFRDLCVIEDPFVQEPQIEADYDNYKILLYVPICGYDAEYTLLYSVQE